MAAHPVVVIDDELLEKLPERFKADPRYQRGASLELVPVSTSQQKRQDLSVEETLRLWESLRGISTSDFDPNTELEKEKQRELEEEAKWLRS